MPFSTNGSLRILGWWCPHRCLIMLTGSRQYVLGGSMRKSRSALALKLVSTHKQKAPPAKRVLSVALWGTPWSANFPVQLSDTTVTVETGTYEEVAEFSRAHYREIYENDPATSPFLLAEEAPAKEEYYSRNGDFFLFKDEGRVVGFFVGTPIDWGSYYLRNASLLPRYQGKKLYQKFLVYFLECLAARGIKRAEGDVAPSNLGHIHVLNKLAFNISGFNISERWGALVHFTRFLDETHEQRFLDQFCWGVKPQRRT